MRYLGLEYNRYENEHGEIFEKKASDRAFEEGSNAWWFSQLRQLKVKALPSTLTMHRNIHRSLHSRNHRFSVLITEEAIEDNLYDRLSVALHQGIGSFNGSNQANQRLPLSLNNAFTAGASAIGDGAALCSTLTQVYLATRATFSPQRLTSTKLRLSKCLIEIAGMTDERGLKIAVRGMKACNSKRSFSSSQKEFLNSNLRSGHCDNDNNAMKNMGMIPDGAVVKPLPD